MRTAFIAIATFALLGTGVVSAQEINLTGRYICVQLCQLDLVGGFAYVTQNGWELNLVNEAGQPSRAWMRWGGRFWAENWNQGAIYSPNGTAIQFDRGTVWQRDFGSAPPPYIR